MVLVKLVLKYELIYFYEEELVKLTFIKCNLTKFGIWLQDFIFVVI